MNLYFFWCLPDCMICVYVTVQNFTEQVEQDLSLPITHLALPSSWCSPAHLVEKRRSHWNHLGRHTGMAPRQFASSSSFPIRWTKLHLMCYVHMCQDCIGIEVFHLSITACFFLTLALALRLLYYFSFVTAWPVELEVASTHVFKGRS